MIILSSLISIKSILWFGLGLSALIFEKQRKLQVVIFISLTCLLFSIPNQTDTVYYLATLKDGYLYGNEIGYRILQKILITILSAEETILAIKFIILVTPLVYIYKNNFENFFYSSNLYILTIFLFLSFTNNLRQGLCITFFSVGALCFNKSKLLSIILMALACSFHYFSIPFILCFSFCIITMNFLNVDKKIIIIFFGLCIIFFTSMFNDIIYYFGFQSWSNSTSWSEPSRFDTPTKVILVTTYVLITNLFIKIDVLNIRYFRYLFIFFINNLLFFSVNYEIINRIIFFLYAIDAYLLLYFLIIRNNLAYCRVLTLFYLFSPNIYKILIK